MGLRYQYMDEGLQTGFARVDKDLEALDQRIDRRREECEQAQEELRAAEGRIEILEERSCTQREMIEVLMARVENMEGKLCHCGKGKECDAEVRGLSLLDSPITLGQGIDEESSSEDSYRTPLMAGSSTLPVSSSPSSIGEHALVLYDSRDPRKEKMENKLVTPQVPILVPSPRLDTAGITRLIAVRGQRAVRTLGRPKSTFHPYACCSIGERCSTHRPSRLCSHGDHSSRTSMSGRRYSYDDGDPSFSPAPRRDGHDGGADGRGQQ